AGCRSDAWRISTELAGVAPRGGRCSSATAVDRHGPGGSDRPGHRAPLCGHLREHHRLVLQRAPTGSHGLCAGRAGCPKPDLVHGLVLPALGILRSCVGRSTRAARTRPGSAHAPWSPTARLCVDRAPACQLPLLVTRLGPAALRSALPAHHRCGTGLVSRSAAGTLVDLRHLSRRARKHLVCPGLRIPTSTRSCRRPTPCANGPHGCNGGGLAAHRSRRYSLAGRRPTDAVLPSAVRVDVCRWCSRVPTSMAGTC